MTQVLGREITGIIVLLLFFGDLLCGGFLAFCRTLELEAAISTVFCSWGSFRVVFGLVYFSLRWFGVFWVGIYLDLV